MKNKRFLAGMFGIMLIFGFVMLGCEQSVTYSSVSAVLGIKVGGVAAELGTPSDQWNQTVAGRINLYTKQLTG